MATPTTPPLADDQTRRPPRRRVVEEVVHGMLQGIQAQASRATGAEVMCACLTLTLRTINASMQYHPEAREAIRNGVEVLYLACADERVEH